MKLPATIPIYGDTTYRGSCPTETAEAVTVFNFLRRVHPDTYGRIAVHVKNEGKRNYKQAARDKAQGMVTGASDINIPGCPAFVCELKRRDHMKSTITDEQVKYLEAAQANGAFACVALGFDGFMEAFEECRASGVKATKTDRVNS